MQFQLQNELQLKGRLKLKIRPKMCQCLVLPIPWAGSVLMWLVRLKQRATGETQERGGGPRTGSGGTTNNS
jgi:hypothetical protein